MLDGAERYCSSLLFTGFVQLRLSNKKAIVHIGAMAYLSRFHPTSAGLSRLAALVVTCNGVYRTSLIAGANLSPPLSRGRSRRVFATIFVVRALSQRPLTLLHKPGNYSFRSSRLSICVVIIKDLLALSSGRMRCLGIRPCYNASQRVSISK
jgi:hypothetical protein